MTGETEEDVSELLSIEQLRYFRGQKKKILKVLFKKTRITVTPKPNKEKHPPFHKRNNGSIIVTKLKFKIHFKNSK